MKKGLIVAATAVALLGVSAAGYHAYARHDGWGYGRHHAQISKDDMAAYADARIAALRAGLTLTPEQQKHWPAVETALKELAQKRVERREEFRKMREERRAERRDRSERADRGERANPIERLRKGADRMTERGADMKRLADATEPLYNSLDDAQKRRFNRLASAGMRNEMRQEGRHWQRGGGERRFEREHRGYRGEHGPRFRDRMGWGDDAPQPGSERL